MHGILLNSGLMVKKNIRYIMSRPCPAGAFGSLDMIYLIFKKITKPELRIATLYAQFKEDVSYLSGLLDLLTIFRFIQVQTGDPCCEIT